MRCYECDGTYKEHTGSLSLHNKFIGNYEIFNVIYYKCENCGKLLFPKETTIKIENKEQECRDNLIKKLSIGEFASASEAANILNISRQALHKHKRIRRGFVYSIIFDGKKLYHKKSILLFKEQGDGRFPLTDEVPSNNVRYLFMPQIPIQKRTDYVGPFSESDIFSTYKQVKTKSTKCLH